MPQLTDPQQQAAAMKLAELDFRLAPPQEIADTLASLSPNQIRNLRKSPLYLQTTQDLQQAWREKMLQLPGTSDLRRKINHNLTLALQRLTETLEAPLNKDTMTACKLAAQMDGRFMGTERSPADAESTVDTQATAQEILTVIGRIDAERKPQ